MPGGRHADLAEVRRPRVVDDAAERVRLRSFGLGVVGVRGRVAALQPEFPVGVAAEVEACGRW